MRHMQPMCLASRALRAGGGRTRSTAVGGGAPMLQIVIPCQSDDQLHSCVVSYQDLYAHVVLRNFSCSGTASQSHTGASCALSNGGARAASVCALLSSDHMSEPCICCCAPTLRLSMLQATLSAALAQQRCSLGSTACNKRIALLRPGCAAEQTMSFQHDAAAMH